MLLFLCLAVLAYQAYRKDARPDILQAMWIVSGLGSASFAASALFYGATTPDWLQGWVYTLRAVPYDAACAIVALLVVRSVGNKYPKLRRWLLVAPWLFGGAIISGMVSAVVFPVPALAEYTPVSVELLAMKARTIPELVYPCLTGTVFAIEMVRRNTPSLLLRVQYFFLCLASVCFINLVLLAIYGTYLRINTVPTASELGLIDWQLSAQTYMVGLGCLGYFFGAALYHSDEERERLIGKFQHWIRFRHDLELVFDQTFGSDLKFGKGLGHSQINSHYYSATRWLHNHSTNGGYSQFDEDMGEKLFLLLGILTFSRDRYQLIKALRDIQQEIIQISDPASRIFVNIDKRFRYDIRQDALFQAIGPALAIADGSGKYLPLKVQPDWLQLSLLMASRVGFIPQFAKGTKYEEAAEHVKADILSAYLFGSRNTLETM